MGTCRLPARIGFRNLVCANGSHGQVATNDCWDSDLTSNPDNSKWCAGGGLAVHMECVTFLAHPIDRRPKGRMAREDLGAHRPAFTNNL